jgi:hypothetical protein
MTIKFRYLGNIQLLHYVERKVFMGAVAANLYNYAHVIFSLKTLKGASRSKLMGNLQGLPGIVLVNAPKGTTGQDVLHEIDIYTDMAVTDLRDALKRIRDANYDRTIRTHVVMTADIEKLEGADLDAFRKALLEVKFAIRSDVTDEKLVVQAEKRIKDADLRKAAKKCKLKLVKIKRIAK